MSEQTETLYLILEYLQSLKDAEGNNADDIDTISSLIESQFEVSITPETFKKHSVAPLSLSAVIAAGKEKLGVQSYESALAEAKSNPKFESFVDAVVQRGYFEGTEEGSVEYMQRHAKLLNKFHERTHNAGPSQAELEKQAEELKVKGNTAINSKDFETAIKYYSEALKLCPDGPQSHVYFSNRAAAHCHLNRYQDAVDDCLSSVALSPDYVKAYSRLGLSYFFLEKYQEAVEAYERAAEIEPDNKSTQDSLRQARNKLKKKHAKDAVTTHDVPSSSAAAGGGPGAGGFPGMGNMMNNPAMKKALDQVGGPSGLSNLMKDPQMMAMAQQMMKDPAMMQQAMAMLGGSGGGGGGGGGGGMPDLSALAGMMGGAGGMNPSNAPPSSSSSVPSSSSSKKKFKGFEE
jgi:small glutamine-rich tetratricopeptide repeat-containing protein alpha